MSRNRWLPWAALSVAVLGSVAASTFFSAWLGHLGGALRELAVLVFAFGVLEKLWDAKEVKPSYFPWVLAMGLALYSLGAIVEPAGHGSHESRDRSLEDLTPAGVGETP